MANLLSTWVSGTLTSTGRIITTYNTDRYQFNLSRASGSDWWFTNDSDKLGLHINNVGDKFYFGTGGDFWSSANGWLSTALSNRAPKAYVTDSYVEFTIEGDADTYYPVTIHNWNGAHSWQRYSIHRNYSDTAPWDPIGTGSHRGGLTFAFEWAGDIAWGGNDKSIRVIEFNETYTQMVAGLQLAHCEGVVVWLRGGGAYYRLHGPGGRSQGYSINMSTWTSCAGVQYSPMSYDSGRVNTQIYNRYPLRGIGDTIYAQSFVDINDEAYYLNPNGTSNLVQLTTSTRARWNMPRVWYDRSSRSSDQNYWTGTNGWGTEDGNWDGAWRGGFSGWDIWGNGTGHPQGNGYIHAQGIVSGQHYAASDGSSGYGWMMVGAHNATDNRYWLRGKWAATTSSWVEMITTGNIGSQSVSYASSAGNSDTLDNLDSSEFARGRAAYQALNLDTIKQPGLYQYDGGIGGTQPEGVNQYNLRTIEIGSGGRYSQMAFDWASEQAWFRRQTGDTWSTWREFIHSGNIGSQNVALLQGYSAYSLIENSRGTHSGSDFPNGTLVTTDINASEWAGASFVMEVSGKSYSSQSPFKLIMQGYLYADTIINVSAMSYGSYFPAPVKVMNLNGNLAFWWPRGSYWNSFEVHVRDAGGSGLNRVTGIDNSVDPEEATKKVSCTPIQVLHTNTSSISTNDLNSLNYYGSNYFQVNSSRATSEFGHVAQFRSTQSAASNYIPFSFQSQYGNHSWGQVARFHIEQSGADRPSIQFSSGSNNTRWNIGYCYPDDQFRISQNMGYRPDLSGTYDGWGTERFKINTDGNIYVGGILESGSSLRAPIFYDSQDTSYYVDPNSSSQLSSVYANNWFRPQGNSGLYFQSYGRGIWSADSAGASYGNVATYGDGVNSWPGYTIGNYVCFMARDIRRGIYVSDQGNWLIRWESADNMAHVDFELQWGSDIRHKSNIKRLTNSLEKVKQLKGVSYNYKGNERTSIGFIAQEVEPILPEVVSTDADGFKSVGYANIVALLSEAIKEQQAMIEELKARIDVLESK